MEIIYNQPTLRQAMIVMHRLQNRGFNCFFSGKGDGSVRLIVEDCKLTIVPAQQLIEEVKDGRL